MCGSQIADPSLNSLVYVPAKLAICHVQFVISWVDNALTYAITANVWPFVWCSATYLNNGIARIGNILFQNIWTDKSVQATDPHWIFAFFCFGGFECCSVQGNPTCTTTLIKSCEHFWFTALSKLSKRVTQNMREVLFHPRYCKRACRFENNAGVEKTVLDGGTDLVRWYLNTKNMFHVGGRIEGVITRIICATLCCRNGHRDMADELIYISIQISSLAVDHHHGIQESAGASRGVGDPRNPVWNATSICHVYCRLFGLANTRNASSHGVLSVVRKLIYEILCLIFGNPLNSFLL